MNNEQCPAGGEGESLRAMSPAPSQKKVLTLHDGEGFTSLKEKQ
jgi:hypothetical protein